jgi:hypothetical protein
VSSTCRGFAAGLPQMGVPAASAGVASVPGMGGGVHAGVASVPGMGGGVHASVGCMDGERPGGASAQVGDVPTATAGREAFARALARGAGAKSPPSGRGHRSKAMGGRGGLFVRVSALGVHGSSRDALTCYVNYVWPCAEVDHLSEVSMGTPSRRCQSAERVQIQRHGLRVNNPSWRINKCKQSHGQHTANAISHDVFTLGFCYK